MKIDSILDLKTGIRAMSPKGDKIGGRIRPLTGEDFFIFEPETPLEIKEGSLLRISDGEDSVLAVFVEDMDNGMKMSVESYVSPGTERREDVRIYDNIYYLARFLCHAEDASAMLPEARREIRSQQLIIDSFLKGKYGPSGAKDVPYTRESPFNQSLWEINRKLDLLIHMTLSNDFRLLMEDKPREVNISASGIKFVSETPFDPGDMVDIAMILPMIPLLYMRFVGGVIRTKPITLNDNKCYSVAVRFEEISPDNRDDIIRYLFRRQRELLRKRREIMDTTHRE
ncbi:MAG: PilZ domain-containing protein [Thermodesulfobacteriota bacterium]|nr:PilZ domain-containing protein [Thermodesulfobacteriota bacterium]